MEKIKNENGTKCSKECPYLKRFPGSCMGKDGLPRDIFECLLHCRIFNSTSTQLVGPGNECPFAVLREVLGVQEVQEVQEPETAEKKEEVPDDLSPSEQCRLCTNWVFNGGTLKCAPPSDGTPCPNRRPMTTKPAVRSCSLPASELPGVREALREWGEEQMRLRNRDRASELQNQAARLANQASTMRHLIHATNRLQNVRSRLQSITTAPSAEARTCSGDLATCNCTMCRILRTISYIDGESVT